MLSKNRFSWGWQQKIENRYIQKMLFFPIHQFSRGSGLEYEWIDEGTYPLEMSLSWNFLA